MAGLRMTVTRLALLASIEAGEVRGVSDLWRDRTGHLVAARVRELQAADLVEPTPTAWFAGPPTLTDAGQTELATAREWGEI